MVALHSVLVVTEEPTTAEAVTSALNGDGNRGRIGVCDDLTRLPAQLTQAPSNVVLVDLDPRPDRSLDELGPIIREFGDTRFVVLCREVRQEWLLQAMEIGARQFLLKDDVGDRLGDVLKRLMPEPPREAAGGTEGTMVTILSASGGCGATTLAINLANELYLDSSKPTLLVDLDTTFGSVASYLGLDSQYSVSDVLADGGRIDPELVMSTAVPYSHQFEVLLSPAAKNPFDSGNLRFDNLKRVMECCRQAFTYTIVDAPRVPSYVAFELAAASSITFVVFEQNVEDLRIARALLRSLREHGIAEDDVCALANRWCKGFGMITSKETRTALGNCPMARIRNDFKSAINSINSGQPLSVVARRSALRDDVRALAKEVQKIHSRSETTGQRI